MALWPIKAISPCITYELWDGVRHPPFEYNTWLITPPRIYDEAINNISHFFYEPSNDTLVAYITFYTYHYPSWACYLYRWNAETGAFLGRQTASIFAAAWANHAGVGSYNHIYTTMKTGSQIYEVPWDTLQWQRMSQAWT